MQKKDAQLSEITLVGLTERTNNKSEMNPETSKIGHLAGFYWGNNISDDIQHRSKPGITYAVYTDFESDEHGDYTYFIGEAVDSLQGQNLEKLNTITIPASRYTMFTTKPGKMPDTVISAWQEIWAMDEDDFGGKRKYIADFEIHDGRANDPDKIVVDIYIGVEK